jgi:hypothetical protein
MTSVLSVGNRVMGDILEEDFEDTMGLFVDKTRYRRDTTTT